MRIIRALGMLVCVLPLWGGCVESEDALDPVETEAAADLTHRRSARTSSRPLCPGAVRSRPAVRVRAGRAHLLPRQLRPVRPYLIGR